jgi:hypothetical protein
MRPTVNVVSDATTVAPKVEKLSYEELEAQKNAGQPQIDGPPRCHECKEPLKKMIHAVTSTAPIYCRKCHNGSSAHQPPSSAPMIGHYASPASSEPIVRA